MTLAASAARPNIILIQADQLAAHALGAYGNPFVLTPRMDALAAEGVVFDRAYCNSPLCAPSRASMMTGLLPSKVAAYDNAADFGSSVPTIAHHLRRAGYRTALIGRMHFIGPDQLHGFDERLTTDVYPATLDMVPDWQLSERERLAWYHNSESVFEAGISTATVQRDFDDEVTFRTLRWLTDRARALPRAQIEGATPVDSPRPEPVEGPFFLTASFIHPHDPYEPTAEHWDRYEGIEIDPPWVGALDHDQHDPHSRRLLAMCDLERRTPTAAEVQRARRAYFACVSYIDDQLGMIIDRLTELGLRDNTVIIVTADHGDMLGERGLWYKMSPYEASARVPLIISGPGRWAPTRVSSTVSLVDLLPTLVDLIGAEPPTTADGTSLLPLVTGAAIAPVDTAVIEYLAEGVAAPQLTMVKGRLKLVVGAGDPDLLFDLVNDPDELTNLAPDPAWADVLSQLRKELLDGRDLDRLRADVLASQGRRRFVHESLAVGITPSWDHTPPDLSAQSYVRGDFWDAIRRGQLRPPAGPQP